MYNIFLRLGIKISYSLRRVILTYYIYTYIYIYSPRYLHKLYVVLCTSMPNCAGKEFDYSSPSVFGRLVSLLRVFQAMLIGQRSSGQSINHHRYTSMGPCMAAGYCSMWAEGQKYQENCSHTCLKTYR